MVAEDYIEGAPELLVEVAASSAAKDVHSKKQAYRRNGIQEYLVWRVFDGQLDWWRLQDGEYVALEPDAAGVLRSQVFPGLWLDAPALLENEMGRVLAVLQEGLHSQEHRDFVQALLAQYQE